MTLKEAIREIHDRVRQCFTRHQFATFGDALHWMHNEEHETLEMEAGEQGYSKFSTDILWLISQFGPKAAVDHKIIDTRKVPTLKAVKTIIETDDDAETAKVTTPPEPRARKRKRRRF